MANNRMYLVFKPTGDAVYLGKRMGHGWYNVPDDLAERVRALFNAAEQSWAPSQDDFAVALESGDHQPHAIHQWRDRTPCAGDSAPTMLRFELDPSVPKGTPEDR